MLNPKPQRGSSMAGLTLRALGGFELSLGDQAIALPRKKSRALLTYLALHHDQEQSREKIAGLLWGNSGEEQARASLRQTLTDLRRALPPEDTDGLVIDGEAFALDSSAADVDAIRFHAALEEDGPDALERAVALYRGELLEGFSLHEHGFQEWLERERAHLRRLVMDALGKLLRYYERAGARDAAISTANRLLAFYSLQEEVHRSLMRLYVAQGRRSLALQQYERCRAVLHEELDVEPADETASLYEDVREHRDLASAGAPGPVPEPERKLAVILAADVAGYSRLMSADEEDTLHRLRNHCEVIDGLVAAHNGRVFGSAGDSVIAEFASPVSAVKCAIEIQTKLDAQESELPEARRVRFRIGLNLGDVMIEGDNLMGDGVNVAARLEALARRADSTCRTACSPRSASALSTGLSISANIA
jgi:DNA-binding SARP family transcriptional activator